MSSKSHFNDVTKRGKKGPFFGVFRNGPKEAILTRFQGARQMPCFEALIRIIEKSMFWTHSLDVAL
jgi:hypothetical protein